MSHTPSNVMKNQWKHISYCSLLLSLSTLAHAEETVWKDQAGRPAPNTESRGLKNDFGGWVLATPDADWKQKWETSPDTIPHFRTSDTVRRGERIFILFFFVHPGTDASNNADVTCDIQFIRPDGSSNIDQKNVVCLRGKLQGNPYNIRLSPAVIEFLGEPKDLAGKWTVRVTFKDNQRRVRLPLKTSFTLK